MIVQLLLFAQLSEISGESEISLKLKSPATLAQAAASLIKRNPDLEPLLASARWALNESFAPLSATLQEGDTLAVIPPVAGG